MLSGVPSILNLRDCLTRTRVRRDMLTERRTQIEGAVKRLEQEEELSDLSAALLRTMIDVEVTEGVTAVEELLTEGLQAVFDDQNLSVRADVDIQYGKVSVVFLTRQEMPDGTFTEGAVLDAYGGAVSTVQSVLLRVLVTLRRGMRPVLFLDETLPAFDSKYVHNMGQFLCTLGARLGYDMLLVSHNPALVEAADHAYRIQKTDGKASFRRIRG